MTKVMTTRFGEIEYAREDVLTVRNGLLGFEGFDQFLLIEHRTGSPFRWLQSLQRPELAFLVVDPFQFFANYQVDISDAGAQELELSPTTAQVVYTIVTIPRGKPEEMTVNLAGPIVINAETRQARQFVVENPAFSVKQRLVVDTPVEIAA